MTVDVAVMSAYEKMVSQIGQAGVDRMDQIGAEFSEIVQTKSREQIGKFRESNIRKVKAELGEGAAVYLTSALRRLEEQLARTTKSR